MKCRKVINCKELSYKYGVHRHTMAKEIRVSGVDLTDVWSVVRFINCMEAKYVNEEREEVGSGAGVGVTNPGRERVYSGDSGGV